MADVSGAENIKNLVKNHQNLVKTRKNLVKTFGIRNSPENCDSIASLDSNADSLSQTLRLFSPVSSVNKHKYSHWFQSNFSFCSSWIKRVRGMDPNYPHSHVIGWLIEWLMCVACNFFPFFLKPFYSWSFEFSFIPRISTTHMGRLDQAEFGWIVSGRLRFQKCV